MYKKVLLFVILVFVLSLLSYFGYHIVTKIQKKNAIEQELQTVPEFEFRTLTQKPFLKKDLKNHLATIFIYFNSECHFCQHEAESISQNIERFKEVQFIFVSTEPVAIIQKFAKKHHLNGQSNVVFLWDNLDIFMTRFDATSIPYLLIYNKNQQLIKKSKGQFNAKGILRVLQQKR